MISDAFKHAQPYTDTVFLIHNAFTVHIQGRERLLVLKHIDPNVGFIKAVETTTAQIINQTNWSILEKVRTDEQLERILEGKGRKALRAAAVSATLNT